MADQFVAEIRIFPFNFAPQGWAFCNGQLIPISQNTALFSLLGTMYGGDGKATFALPDLQGRAPLMPGQGPGLSLYVTGEQAGESSVTLLTTEIPAHSHVPQCAAAGNQSGPGNNVWASAGFGRPPQYAIPTNPVSMASSAIGPAGGNLPHNNMMPFLALNFCIALQGIFPARS